MLACDISRVEVTIAYIKERYAAGTYSNEACLRDFSNVQQMNCSLQTMTVCTNVAAANMLSKISDAARKAGFSTAVKSHLSRECRQ